MGEKRNVGDENRASNYFYRRSNANKGTECPVNPFCLEVLRVFGNCFFSRLEEHVDDDDRTTSDSSRREIRRRGFI